MKGLFFRIFIASSFVFLPLAAARAAVEPFANPYYSQDEYLNAHSMFDKVRADLQEARTDASLSDLGDQPRLDIARNEVGHLEQQWDRGRYDTEEFDRAFTALRMVLNDNRMAGHDRDALSADLSRLIEFRNEYY
jgi:hypothetical protein